MSATDSTFRAAIPGSSLTHKMGSYPHEKPPKYVDPAEALEYFWKQLNRKEVLKQIWTLLEQGATVWAITKSVLYKAATEGIIQMNLAVNLYPTVGKMIMTIGQAKGIDVKVYPKFKDKTTDTMMNSKLNEKMGIKDGSQIPPSAMKSMPLPKPQDITKHMKQFMQMPIGQTVNKPVIAPPTPTAPAAQSTGLLAKVKGAI